jgi:hypothetical protein
MRRRLTGAALIALAAAPLLPAAAAAGNPQRGDTLPPGLAKKLFEPSPGFLVALVATVGSQSRLQDLPVSP